MLDIAEFFQGHLRATDNITLKIGFDNLHLLSDSSDSAAGIDMMPLDQVFEWLLHGCDVPVKVSISGNFTSDQGAHYSGTSTERAQCPLLSASIPEDLAV